MLDTATLRLAFGIVAFAVLVLFYVATYRVTHSAYSGWWCVSLGLFIGGASLYLFDGTPVQVVANPSGNALTTAGAASVWSGTRALRDLPVRRGWVVGLPLAVLVVSLADDPATDVWTGGPVFLAAMALALGAASWELRELGRETTGATGAPGATAARTAVVAMAVMSGILSVFYLARALALAAVGPDHVVFDVVLGSQTTTLLTLVMLVVVTYTMSLLGHEQQSDVLRARAERDGLTGLLNRGAFFQRLTATLEDPRSAQLCAVVLVDLDGFKELNDRDGHAAGDRALTAFASVVTGSLADGDSVGRLGGDEFVVLLGTYGRAQAFTRRVADDLRRELGAAGPTASFGIAAGWVGADPDELVHRADVALYRAKTAGRDRAVSWEEPHGARPRAARSRRRAP